MALQVADRVKETTTTTGTGALTLAGAMTGYQAFSAVCSVGDTIWYALQEVDSNGLPTGAWETGIGTYSAASTLTRTTVLASSNSNAAVSLTGTTQVWGDLPGVIAAALGQPQDQGGFVDGNFDSWQLGTSFTLAAATDTYTADMWVCNAGTGGAATVSQHTAALGGEPSYMTRPRKYQLEYAQTTSASTSPTIGQKLEGVGQYNGQTITVQASLMAAAAATDVVGLQVTQNFGTGGSPSSSVVTSQSLSWAIGTAEAKFSAEIAVPSISGKTLGTGGNDYVRIDLLLATGATYTLYSSQMQIDVSPAGVNTSTTGNGGVPRAFRYRGAASEMLRVHRYLETGYVFWQFYAPTNYSDGGTIHYNAWKRAAANLTAVNITYSACQNLQLPVLGNSLAAASFNLESTASSGSYATWNWIADARL